MKEVSWKQIVIWALPALAWVLVSYSGGPLVVLASLISALLIRRVYSRLRKRPFLSPWIFAIAIGMFFLIASLAGVSAYRTEGKLGETRVANCTTFYVPAGEVDGAGVFASRDRATETVGELCDQIEQRSGLTSQGLVGQEAVPAFCKKISSEDYRFRVADGTTPKEARNDYEKLMSARCTATLLKVLIPAKS